MGQTTEVVKLLEGSIWEVGTSFRYLYQYRPTAVICATTGELVVAANIIPVTRVVSVIETNIEGAFEGFDQNKLFSLTNGQVWQQTEYHYEYHYAYRPNAIVFESATGTRLNVEGVPYSVKVQRLR